MFKDQFATHLREVGNFVIPYTEEISPHQYYVHIKVNETKALFIITTVWPANQSRTDSRTCKTLLNAVAFPQ